MSAIIETVGLEKRFSKFSALRGVSFRVNKGAITGLIGPNGAGKTTTIKVLLGLLRPDAGEARVFGKNPWDNPKIMKQLGIIQEKPNFPKNMKIGDYLKRIARMRGYPERRAIELLKQEGLDSAINRDIGKLSAGMLQRFALTHALIHEPELVIADEPTSNLDPQARGDVLNSIVRLHSEKGITFLISSHLLQELSRVCDTAAIISEGRVVASGNLQHLYQTFKSTKTRITTNKVAELAEKAKSLGYVTKVEIAGENLLVETTQDSSSRLYDDAPPLARQIGAELYGIESKSASLEELFRRATTTTATTATSTTGPRRNKEAEE
jgi:ABC-2 type transport system ATP-binding protein